MKTNIELEYEIYNAVTKREALKEELRCEMEIELGFIDEGDFEQARDMHDQNHHLIQCIEDWTDEIADLGKELAKYWIYDHIEN